MGLFKKVAKERGDKIGQIKSLCQKDFFALFSILFISSSLILIKGADYYNENGFFEPVKEYIEEGAVSGLILRQAQSAGLVNSYTFLSVEDHALSENPVNTLQQTALLAFNSLENNFSDFKSSRNDQIAIYTVQEGDNISFIASDFGVSVNTIIWANNIQNVNSIKPGDELKIPPVNGVIHKVKKGDTVASIAKKYSADEDKIIAFNVLPKDGSLQLDEEIIVPDGKIPQQNQVNYAFNATSVIKRFAYLPNLGDFFMTPTIGRDWGIIHGRNGVDIANSCGTPIYAAADGLAAIADGVGWNGGFGKFIKLMHPNSTETVYAHLSKILLNQGESISKGQQIGLMGTTGRSTGCHLHFEVHGAKNPLAKY